jgi:hypothetical protein
VDSHRLDARYNWWNDPTGPSGRGAGFGEAFGPMREYEEPTPPVPTDDEEVDAERRRGGRFELWLSHPNQDLVDPQIGNNQGLYGYDHMVCQGWNTFSTWYALENPNWADVLDLANGPNDDAFPAMLVYVWDGAVGDWDTVSGTDLIVPLQGYMVKMSGPANMFFTSSPKLYVPTLNLPNAEQWYLVGPQQVHAEFPDNNRIPVSIMLESLEGTGEAGNEGYSHVVSVQDPCGYNEGWLYTGGWGGPGGGEVDGQPGGGDTPNMYRSYAYWVYMTDADVYAGMLFNPFPIYDFFGGGQP